MLARFGREVERELTYITRRERRTSARESRCRRSLVGNGVFCPLWNWEEETRYPFGVLGATLELSLVVVEWWYTHPFLRADSKLCSPGSMGVCYTHFKVFFSFSVYNQMD